MSERKVFLLLSAVFLAAYLMPFGHPKVRAAGQEIFRMVQENARQHVLTCLLPALSIAGAMAVFISVGAVPKYLGSAAKRWLSYEWTTIPECSAGPPRDGRGG